MVEEKDSTKADSNNSEKKEKKEKAWTGDPGKNPRPAKPTSGGTKKG